MAALNASPIDYGRVLADLRAKRDEIETAIQAIERIYTPQNVPHAVYETVKNDPVSLPKISKRMGFYDAAYSIIKHAGRPMSSPDILDAMIQAGRKSDSRSISTLYRAIKDKGSDCKIKRIGEGKQGKWSLVEWNNGNA